MAADTYPEVRSNVRAPRDKSFFFYTTHNGWISRDVIVHYLTVVLPEHIRGKNEHRTALLLMDGCGIHYTALFDIFKKCQTVLSEQPGPVPIDATGYIAHPSKGYSPAPARNPAEQKSMNMIREFGADLKVDDVLLYVRMLPANTTALLQPCDQGLIHSAKASWRRQLDTLNLDPVGDFVKGVPVINVMRHLTEHLRGVKPEVGRRYWKPLFGEGREDEEVDRDFGAAQAEAHVALAFSE
jgi:hypothetical protein